MHMLQHTVALLCTDACTHVMLMNIRMQTYILLVSMPLCVHIAIAYNLQLNGYIYNTSYAGRWRQS